MDMILVEHTAFLLSDNGTKTESSSSRFQEKFAKVLPCSTPAIPPCTFHNTLLHLFFLARLKEWRDMLGRNRAPVNCSQTSDWKLISIHLHVTLWLKSAQNLQPTVVSQSFLNTDDFHMQTDTDFETYTETYLEDDQKTIGQI